MALMTKDEKDGIQQQMHKKPMGTRGGCCASCCSCCIRCLSGFIFLLIIAGLFLCVRIFLEFPVIINGFGRNSNFTNQAVNAIITDSADAPTSSLLSGSACVCGESYDCVPCNQTFQVLMGSFQLLNESYHSQYDNTSSAGFQAAASRIQTALNNIFNNSLLKGLYKNASVFSISPSPFTIYVQLLFYNISNSGYGINVDAAAEVLRKFTGPMDNVNISLDAQSVVMGGAAPCPVSLPSGQTWPWQAVILENQSPICMGSLLAGLWVITSASCANTRDISILTVSIGINGSSSNRMWKVAKVIPHPNFTASPITNNIALILLTTPVLFSTSVRPICLPQTVEVPIVGSLCNITTGNIFSGGLMNVAGTLTSALNCLSKSQDALIYVSPTFSNTPYIQVGVGSSLVCTDLNNRGYLHGISSFQQNSTSLSSPCLNYTSIGPVADWITSYILT
ncbi:transmembrane protease serine 11D-like [Spea bombifrons]|uniref:transmembrane protease serine 11D-like n=1 Tax=Spea bombifrons TaxID=233779 RepID=UPI002349AA51|nr:transmembrane protease serine 11D-like [Spea bombifrons]